MPCAVEATQTGLMLKLNARHNPDPKTTHWCCCVCFYCAVITCACQADFSYYFDTGSRRRCYLAPERFFEGSAAAINTAAPLQPDMVRNQSRYRAAVHSLDAGACFMNVAYVSREDRETGSCNRARTQQGHAGCSDT